jgi:hypothetical protein
MADIRLIKVFLASPGDVAHEGNLVRETFDSINRTLGEKEGVRFEVKNWKTDSYPAYGSDGQALLNEQIADMSQYDLFVGIMWNRFGSPTPRAGSGTEEEFLRAVESFEANGNPQIMFYFNQAPFNPTSVKDAEQKMKVLEFKGKVQGKALTHDYASANDFQSDFRNHIESWLVRESPKRLEPPRVESEPVMPREMPKQATKADVLSDSGMWILLRNGFFLADEVSEIGENKVLIKLPVTNADEDATFRSLQPNAYGNREPIPFAHQNIGAIARVTEAKRNSVGGKSIWEFLLTLDENESGYLSEMSYNNLSADQIAEIRARFILFNENPVSNRKQDPRHNLNDTMLEVFVSGLNSPVKVEGSVLPDLWKNVNKDVATFLPVARLWSVFHLITSNTCQYILDLTIGPVDNEKVYIKFRGQRPKRYSNVDPYIMSFEGICNLNSN